ncbi:precorrin-4 C(11)-methyltransferase, partial [Anoxybacillus sp. LAT_38]|nr:precorrin-4 C(11)-methyltransferase [Anoxybacillus sp. LAT_38]
DPSVDGATMEQIALLKRAGIDVEIVPGVSSVFAAAAALGAELTIPELTQTLILTRAEGRTPVPEREKLRALAEHHCTIAL